MARQAAGGAGGIAYSMPRLEYEHVAPNARRARVVETAEEQQARQAVEGLRSKVANLAQSAVGVRLSDLTPAQQRALVAVLLWKAGAVTADLTVKPLEEWER